MPFRQQALGRGPGGRPGPSTFQPGEKRAGRRLLGWIRREPAGCRAPAEMLVQRRRPHTNVFKSQAGGWSGLVSSCGPAALLRPSAGGHCVRRGAECRSAACGEHGFRKQQPAAPKGQSILGALARSAAVAAAARNWQGSCQVSEQATETTASRLPSRMQAPVSAVTRDRPRLDYNSVAVYQACWTAAVHAACNGVTRD